MTYARACLSACAWVRLPELVIWGLRGLQGHADTPKLAPALEVRLGICAWHAHLGIREYKVGHSI